MAEDLSKLIEQIDCFRDDDRLLKQALTHRSYANEKNMISNERLEFLGDAVLSLVISSYLYQKLDGHPEGELTRLRATLVNESFLANIARSLELGSYLRLGSGERKTGGEERSSILADAMEAIIGAIYLKEGLSKVSSWIIHHWQDSIKQFIAEGRPQDAKTNLQELLQKSGKRPEYHLDRTEGPVHERQFFTSVWVQGECYGHGKGRSKKEAQQRAAEEALRNLSANTTYN